MDDITFYLFFALFIFLGAIFGWVAFFRSSRLNRQIAELQQQVQGLRIQLLGLKLGSPPAGTANQTEGDTSTALPLATVEDAAQPESPTSVAAAGPQIRWQPDHPAAMPDPVPAEPPAWLEHLKQNWMVWLGGLCVALAGIFLVRYSIDQGLLGPGARVVAGICMGLGLHAGAEWLRRTRDAHIAFAALAGGGSITLFAALLAALHLYELLSPALAFILLALVSLLSMALALLHGPVLAILGIVGAFVVPILVGGEPGSAHIVLGYTLVICSATLLLMGYVQRRWLWVAALVGGLTWWLLTLGAAEVDGWRGFYLALLTLIFFVFPERDWQLQLRQGAPAKLSVQQLFATGEGPSALLPLGLLLLIAAFGISLSLEGYSSSGELVNWLALPALLLWVAGSRAQLALHAWVLLLVQMAALLLWRWQTSGFVLLDAALIPAFRQFCVVLAVVYSGLALFNLRQGSNTALWVSLAVMAPLCGLILSWLLTGGVQPSIGWSLLACALALAYLAMAGFWLKRGLNTLVLAWLFIGGHLGYSLAVTMYLREAGLTLALAVQIVSLAWIIRRFKLEALDTVLKLVVMAVIVRLSLNPWLVDYAPRMAWPLWVYGGATLCCLAGNRLLPSRPALQAWTGGAFIHLLALSIWVLVRHLLYDGAVFSARYTLTEAALNLNLFAALGLVYHWRAHFSQHLAMLCRLYAKVLLLLALATYSLILLRTLNSDPWVWTEISSRPFANLMLLAYGLPVLWFYLCSRFYLPQVQRLCLALAALSGFAFISLEIMHLWRGDVRFDGSMSDGELYTYSVVWLLMAVALLLGGAWRWGTTVYKAGLLLLCLVIGKLFVVDMAGLTGLLRVASFMGMGLALLAIGYLHQRLQGTAPRPVEEAQS